jgi:DNA polymerase-3 subunit gamma/tau
VTNIPAPLPPSTPAIEQTQEPVKPPTVFIPQGEKPKTAAKTVKLTDLLKADTKKEEIDSATGRPADQSFTDEQLRTAWNDYAEQRKKFQAEYQMLSQPFQVRNNQIVVTLLSPVHETMLNNVKAEIATYLRDRLKNSTIQIVGELKEPEEGDKKIYYTARDKFDYLVEKNPALREMKDRLGLDPDF